METLGTQYVETMVSSLNYILGRTSSAIVDRREVKILPRGGTEYSPRTQKTIEFSITDSASYLLCNTLKLQFKIESEAPAANAELEFWGLRMQCVFNPGSSQYADRRLNFWRTTIARIWLWSNCCPKLRE